MHLTEDTALNIVQQLAHLSCGGRPIDKYLSALVIDSLGIFDARAAVLFGLEEDLGIEIFGSFGITPGSRSELGSLHLLRPSLFSSCLSATKVSEVPNNDAVSPRVFGARHTVLLPIRMRGAAYAGLTIWLVENPEIDDQETFWEAVGLTSGLALTCHWTPRAKSTRTDAPTQVDLTLRQLDIISLVAQGLTNREIARQLNYGQSTVGHELMRIFRILEVDSREAASREAAKRGILSMAPNKEKYPTTRAS